MNIQKQKHFYMPLNKRATTKLNKPKASQVVQIGTERLTQEFSEATWCRTTL